jgi:hypothetical protein
MAVSPRKGVFIPKRATFVRKRKHSSRERFEPGYLTKEKQKLKAEKDNIINLKKALNKCGARMECVRKVVKRSRICRHGFDNSESEYGKVARVYLRNGGYMHLENDKWFYHKKE